VRGRPTTTRVQTVLERLFGCWHRNVSRPFTISGRTYEVCLDCGKQFAYARVDFQHSALARRNPMTP
jgi:hypothetical protein